ncbi:hypothetical protein LUX29_06805 [Aureimonas altamirensis]|uniref:rhamnan synthesis F family protein n=1 Tax=Aureimonas altamirensis TaxID=370622 RepID=UPI001E52A620|nr:rhamnan synthesis F family protein [Aureimonas altamirensis]UHD46899.1 hypothetical protein LUX29_06805 [Aureimonas altamirensis]
MSKLHADALPQVSVFVQVHYPDIWQDMSGIIAERMATPFRLILTTSHHGERLAIPDTPNLASHHVLYTANQGRDILPFLRALAAEPEFDIGLKLHTKKSPQRGDGDRWRTDILNSLLPDQTGTRRIVRKLAEDPRVGCVAPDRFCLPVEPWILENGDAMRRAMEAIAPAAPEAYMDGAYFAAGSMFWFRRNALTALASERLFSVFEPEMKQLDGTIAHGLERLFPVEARRQGFLTMPLSTLMATGPQTPADQVEAITRLEVAKPNPLFPSPYESPASASLPVDRAPAKRADMVARLGPIYMALPLPLRRLAKSMLKRFKTG